MASQVDVCNLALTKLGAARITSIADNSKSARTMSSLWDVIRRSELSKSFWTFALKRASLPALGTPPAFGFANYFQLPSDYLRLYQVSDVFVVPSLADYREGDDSAWAVEGLTIATDFAAPLQLRYIADITDPGIFHSLFVTTFAARLAYEACYDITQSNQRQDAVAQDYKDAMQQAKRMNAIEKPPQGFPDDSWNLGRL